MIFKKLENKIKEINQRTIDIFNYLKIFRDVDLSYLYSIKKELLEQEKNNKKNDKVVYTCLTASYDNLFIHTYYNKDWDYICFTDNTELIKLGRFGIWQIKPLHYSELDNTRNARWHKIHPHILLHEYSYSLYLDANVDIRTPYIFACVDKVLYENIKFSIPNHFVRDCIYEEAQAVIDIQKDDPDIINKQINEYRKEGFPEHFGLTETSIMFRIHNDKEVIKMMDEWWYFIKNYSKRDQLSLHYVLWKNDFKMTFLTRYPMRLDSKNFNACQHINGVINVDELYYRARSLGLI